MKTATISEIKRELELRSTKESKEIILRLARFKKENKELLTYLLFESDNESSYIESVKREIDLMFSEINTSSVYYIKKSVRKILRHTKTRIRYSLKKETEIELLIYFCKQLTSMNSSVNSSIALQNILIRQLQSIRNSLPKLHEDLRYDFQQELNKISY